MSSTQGGFRRIRKTYLRPTRLRRLCHLAVGLMAIVGTMPGAMAQDTDDPKISWKLGTWGRPRAATASVEALKRHVEDASGGRFTIAIGYDSFGGPKELLDLLKIGSLQAVQFCSAYHPEKTPAYTALDLPFLPVADADAQERVHEAFHRHSAVVKELAGWNARLYTSNLLPQFEFMGKGQPPRRLEDWKGIRVRAIGGLGDAIRRIGAVPTSMDATEVYTALERGVVDAVSFPFSYGHAAFRIHELSRWTTENMSPGTTACPSVINIEAWNGLPERYRALIEESKPKAYAAAKAAYAAADEKNVPMFRQKGLAFIRYSDPELAEFRRVAAQPVWDDWVRAREAQGIPGREMLTLILDAASGSKR